MKKRTRWGFIDAEDGDEAERIMLECLFRNEIDASRSRDTGIKEGRKYGPLMRIEMTINENN